MLSSGVERTGFQCSLLLFDHLIVIILISKIKTTHIQLVRYLLHFTDLKQILKKQ